MKVRRYGGGEWESAGWVVHHRLPSLEGAGVGLLLFMGRCPKPQSFISFACPKEMNQRKRQPQIFFGINILEAAHAIQLVVPA